MTDEEVVANAKPAPVPDPGPPPPPPVARVSPMGRVLSWARRPVVIVGAAGVVLAVALGSVAAYNYRHLGGWEDRALAAESSLSDTNADLASLEKQISALQAENKGLRAKEAEVLAAEQALADREAAVQAREDAVTQTEQQVAANTVKEGTWTVGVDIEPGTHRTDSEVGGSRMCYWSLTATGSNGDNILSNDIVTGGFLVVTVQAGQDFTTRGCGSWVKQ